MSLSRRLVLTVVALAAVGLAVVAVVSYLALRSYLSDRLDQQAVQSLPQVLRLVGDAAPVGGSARFDLPAPPPEDGGVPPGLQLPAGTYVEVRDAEGNVLTTNRVRSGDEALSKPDLPASIDPPEGSLTPITFDAPSSGGEGPGYRVVAVRGPGGEVLIAALPDTELQATLTRLRRIELIVSAAVLVALAVLSFLAVRGGLRPLARMERTAREIAAGDMSHRVEEVDERTEVGRLGIAFNEMLARLERSFAEQRAAEQRLRRFLADASHELRTPLASIRGYAELFDRGARSNPEHLERSMSRIESESKRMSGLVDDLLTLARLDEVRPGTRQPVDLAAIVVDARDDAEARHPDREVQLEMGSTSRVLGDPDALRQLVANLLGNALTHAPDGPVELSVDGEGDQVELTVRDHGPGLPRGAEEHVFDRFWRADEARDRKAGGSGLGLAIVAAIAASHGGTATARNAERGGAAFTVRLPRVEAGPAG